MKKSILIVILVLVMVVTTALVISRTDADADTQEMSAAQLMETYSLTLPENLQALQDKPEGTQALHLGEAKAVTVDYPLFGTQTVIYLPYLVTNVNPVTADGAKWFVDTGVLSWTVSGKTATSVGVNEVTDSRLTVETDPDTLLQQGDKAENRLELNEDKRTVTDAANRTRLQAALKEGAAADKTCTARFAWQGRMTLPLKNASETVDFSVEATRDYTGNPQ